MYYTTKFRFLAKPNCKPNFLEGRRLEKGFSFGLQLPNLSLNYAKKEALTMYNYYIKSKRV